jgi:hypothetical protein
VGGISSSASSVRGTFSISGLRAVAKGAAKTVVSRA